MAFLPAIILVAAMIADLSFGAGFAGSKLAHIGDSGVGDVVQSLLGQEGLVRGDDHIGHSHEPHQLVILDDVAGHILIEQVGFFLVHVQPGTAGSSLKVYIAACGILNYAEGYDTADEETLRRGVTAWMNAAAPDTLEMVRETFYAVTGAAEGVLAGDAESLALLADAGSPNRYDSYDPDRYETVKNILTELLQPQASDEGGAE